MGHGIRGRVAYLPFLSRASAASLTEGGSVLVIFHAVGKKYNTFTYISQPSTVSRPCIFVKKCYRINRLLCAVLWNSRVKYVIIELQHSASSAVALNTYNSCFRCSNENDSGSGWIIGHCSSGDGTCCRRGGTLLHGAAVVEHTRVWLGCCESRAALMGSGQGCSSGQETSV